jgi:AraC family transcriptional regulator
VIQYIDSNLDGDLSCEQLSRVASFSKFHFHRQFSALFGVSLHRYIALLRMRKASYELAFRDHKSITQIALDSSYENPESFSRTFKKATGQTPTDFRTQPQWQPGASSLLH